MRGHGPVQIPPDGDSYLLSAPALALDEAPLAVLAQHHIHSSVGTGTRLGDAVPLDPERLPTSISNSRQVRSMSASGASLAATPEMSRLRFHRRTADITAAMRKRTGRTYWPPVVSPWNMA